VDRSLPLPSAVAAEYAVRKTARFFKQATYSFAESDQYFFGPTSSCNGLRAVRSAFCAARWPVQLLSYCLAGYPLGGGGLLTRNQMPRHDCRKVASFCRHFTHPAGDDRGSYFWSGSVPSIYGSGFCCRVDCKQREWNRPVAGCRGLFMTTVGVLEGACLALAVGDGIVLVLRCLRKVILDKS
jgi:hypothetical protein